MKLEIGAEVLGPDGKLGHLTRIVFAPDGERVSHVVVERGGLHPFEKVVPAQHLRRSEGHRVWIDLGLSQIEGLQDYLGTDWSGSAPAVPSEVPLADVNPVGLLWPTNVLGWYLPSHQTRTANHLQSNLPPGSHGLTAGTEVHCKDGKAGHLEEVLYDEASGKVTGMVIRKGFLFVRDVEAPVDWVERIDDRIILNVSCDELSERRRKPT